MVSKQYNKQITWGIPQGSILGPVLLPNCLKQTTPRMFADDTGLIAAGETLGEVERGQTKT